MEDLGQDMHQNEARPALFITFAVSPTHERCNGVEVVLPTRETCYCGLIEERIVLDNNRIIHVHVLC